MQKQKTYSLQVCSIPTNKCNGENFITFDLIEIDDEKREVTVAVSDTGRISVKTFDLLFDGNRRYFEYGCSYTKIYVDEFTEEN